MCLNGSFFPAIFFLPILYVFYFPFLSFPFIFCALSRKWRPALFVLTLRHLFFYGLLAIQSQKLLNYWTSLSDRSEQVIKSKDFRRETKKWMAAFFLFKRVRNVIKKAVSICVIILQDRKEKKFNFTISKFRAQRYEDIWPTKKTSRALKRKGRRTCRHGARRIWKLFSKRRPAGKLTWCDPPRKHLDYLWRNNIQRRAPKTLDELRQWLINKRFARKNVPLDYFGSSYILYLTTYTMWDNIKEDNMVTYILVIQC